MAALALGDGKKNFKAGMKFEESEQWDQAAEAFALAVTENPKNPEYRLHLQRALFNASQLYMKKGRIAADEKDFQGAYIAYRKAYAYDPVNELAKAEMARMVRLQEEANKAESERKPDATTGKVKLVPTGYTQQPAADVQIPQRIEKLRDVPFPGGVDLQYIVKELAKDLDLNVLFDADSRLDNRKIRIELKNVSAAKALDYIFLQENLFFQKVGPRTVIVATNNQRTKFQQLVLRTFYLSNADPAKVKPIIQQAIPAQPGRSQTIVIEDAATNSLTVRDTEENIRLIGRLISSLDKDRAEVVMDVAIYEVNKNDLLEFGNQVGTRAELTNFGGTTRSVVDLGGNDLFGKVVRGVTSTVANPTNIFGTGLILPAANLVAFQRKNNTKLIASTQIHAFNNEDSSARIGQRVPVQTAQFVTGNNNTTNGVVSNVINYEQVGLTLKFKPIVFPNQDVQVAMEIESKDVADLASLTPIFTERTIKGTARVQNNKTLLLASVAQGSESNGRQGLPLLGLIPIIGRLFTAPTKNNSQVDIVIAVTPRVIRAPSILPEDEVERPTGSLATPTNGSLEAMIVQEDRDELLAAARRLPNVAQVQLPDQPLENPAYVRSTGAAPSAALPAPAASTAPATDATALNLKPIDTSVKTLQINQTSDTVKAPATSPEPQAAAPQMTPLNASSLAADVQIPSMGNALKVGERAKIAVMVNASSSFRSAVIGLKYDQQKLAIRSVSFGDIFGTPLANSVAAPFLNQGGKMYVSLSMAEGSVKANSGVLAYIEVEALAEGTPALTLEKDVLNFLAPDGKTFALKF